MMRKILFFFAFLCLPLFLLSQENGINLAPNAEQGFKKENLGKRVNTRYSELLPVISADGKTLYIARENAPGGFGGQDVWVSTLKPDSSWREMKNIGKPINNRGANNVISVTPDGNTLLVLNTYKPDGTLQGTGISISQRTQKGWTVPREIKIEDYQNLSRFEGYCLSADRRVILMYVQRDDSYGGLDLYVSFLKEDDKWSKPKNLGKTVNTPKDDITPYLAPDNVSLYYATSGKPGYGSFDIFVTRRLDSTWTNWSEPENLGSDINTKGFDAYFTVQASGEYAYLISNQNAIGKSDIFRIKLADAIKPEPLVLVSGTVFNQKTGEPIAAEISYNDLATGKQKGIARSGQGDGKYQIALPAGTSYDFLAQKDGFYSISENLDTKNLTKYKEIERDLYLAPIETGEVIRLNNLFFDSGKWTLKPKSEPELRRLAKILESNPAMQIEIAGHTDSEGSSASNLELSKNRANAVFQNLKAKGISPSQMKVKGYGESKPVTTNETPEGRAKNRRVEFEVLKK